MKRLHTTVTFTHQKCHFLWSHEKGHYDIVNLREITLLGNKLIGSISKWFTGLKKSSDLFQSLFYSVT
jgi:hypothetical protein